MDPASDDRWTPRVRWDELPTAVQTGIERLLGSRVLEARSQVGGFSPGMAAIVRCADGSRAFVKAVGSELNPQSPTLHRTESRIAAELPPSAPTPSLLATYDDGDWVALAFEAVDGRMPTSSEPAARRGRAGARDWPTRWGGGDVGGGDA